MELFDTHFVYLVKYYLFQAWKC